MKHKVSELEGELLDAAVALAESNGDRGELASVMLGLFSPSTEWRDGGPIIEREGIETSPRFNMRTKLRAQGWAASLYHSIDGVNEDGCAVASADGPTLLIAAMRAYVASKFGDEVELRI